MEIVCVHLLMASFHAKKSYHSLLQALKLTFWRNFQPLMFLANVQRNEFILEDFSQNGENIFRSCCGLIHEEVIEQAAR